MPITVSIDPKKVIINTETEEIIKLYESALDSIFSSHTVEPVLSVSEKKSRKSKHFLSGALEAIWGSNTEVTLCASQIQLNTSTHTLLKAYTKYLNEISLKSYTNYLSYTTGDLIGTDSTRMETPKLTEAVELSQPYLVVREIMIRLMTVALSEDTSSIRNGDTLLKVMDHFLSKVCNSRLLKRKYLFFKPTVSSYERSIVSGAHQIWMNRASELIDILQKLHSNNIIITSSLDYLEATAYHLKIRILSILNPDIPCKEALSSNWIDNIFPELENVLVTKSPDLDQVDNEVNQLSCSDQEKRIIQLEKNNATKDHGLLAKLYVLLAATRELKNILTQIEMLLSISGWVPFVMGILSLEDLGNKIKDHGRCSAEAITINESDPLFNKPIGSALVSYSIQPSINFSIQTQTQEISDRLKELMDPEQLKFIIEMGTTVINKLLQSQTTLEIVLVNQKNLSRFYNKIGGYSAIKAEQQPDTAKKETPIEETQIEETINCLAKLAAKGNADLIETTFSKEFNVNALAHYASTGPVEIYLGTFTPLSLAVAYGHIEVVTLLTSKYGAQVDITFGWNKNYTVLDCINQVFWEDRRGVDLREELKNILVSTQCIEAPIVQSNKSILAPDCIVKNIQKIEREDVSHDKKRELYHALINIIKKQIKFHSSKIFRLGLSVLDQLGTINGKILLENTFPKKIVEIMLAIREKKPFIFSNKKWADHTSFVATALGQFNHNHNNKDPGKQGYMYLTPVEGGEYFTLHCEAWPNHVLYAATSDTRTLRNPGSTNLDPKDQTTHLILKPIIQKNIIYFYISCRKWPTQYFYVCKDLVGGWKRSSQRPLGDEARMVINTKESYLPQQDTETMEVETDSVRSRTGTASKIKKSHTDIATQTNFLPENNNKPSHWKRNYCLLFATTIAVPAIGLAIAFQTKVFDT